MYVALHIILEASAGYTLVWNETSSRLTGGSVNLSVPDTGGSGQVGTELFSQWNLTLIG